MRVLAVPCALVFACAAPQAPSPQAPAAADVSDLDVPEREGVDADKALHSPTHIQPGHLSDTMRPAVYRAPTRDAPRVKRYRGAKIDLDLKGADLHNVFRLLADVGGINIVVSDEIKGRITLRVNRIPWDQALAAIVKTKRLDLQIEDNLYLIMPKHQPSR